MGQHFFFDCGGGDCLAFFWFPDAPEPAPGVSAPVDRPDRGSLTSAIGSMNHVAFAVPPEKIEEYREQLARRRASTAPRSPTTTTASGGSARSVHPGVFVRSIYFQDPDGILLEFACWTKGFGPDDVAIEPATAARPHAGLSSGSRRRRRAGRPTRRAPSPGSRHAARPPRGRAARRSAVRAAAVGPSSAAAPSGPAPARCRAARAARVRRARTPPGVRSCWRCDRRRHVAAWTCVVVRS